MEILTPTPGGIKKAQFSQLPGGGKRRMDLGGTSPKLNEYSDECSENFCCGPTSNPELGATKYMNMDCLMKL